MRHANDGMCAQCGTPVLAHTASKVQAKSITQPPQVCVRAQGGGSMRLPPKLACWSMCVRV